MKIYSSELDFGKEIAAAEAGDTKAMVRVAFAILNGRLSETIHPDEAALAIRYYETAAAHGDKSAIMDLAACYMDGRGVRRDVQTSMQLYAQGFDPTSGSSCFCLGCVHRYDYPEGGGEIPTRSAGRIAKAIDYFTQGAALENADCMYELGNMALHGIGMEKDDKKALIWFQCALDALDEEILSGRGLHIYYALALCYYHGYGTAVDHETAEEYISYFMQEKRRRHKYGEPIASWLLNDGETLAAKLGNT